MSPRPTSIVIGIPSAGRACPLELVLALATQSYPANAGVGWSIVCGQDVDVARQAIAEAAVEMGAKYLWFIDDDTVPPVDAARNLVYVLEQAEAADSNIMVCGGVYTYKSDPAEPLVFMGPNEGPFWKWKAGEVFKVWGMGAGCMMIRTEVFKHLPKPWFKFVSESGTKIGEDLYFCEKVKQAGFSVVAHGGVLCRHFDLAEMEVYTLPEDSFPMLQQPLEADLADRKSESPGRRVDAH